MGETLKLGEYLLAVQGLAMIRAGVTRPSAGRPRIEEMRRILDELPDSMEIRMIEYEVPEGYTRWAEHYDGPNPAIAREQPIVHGILADLPPGRALDAACGTGRHAARLVELGHQVVGVDATPAMLALARKKVPSADFRLGRLESLPVQDATVDLVVCALALTHVPDLRPVLAEFARVLRPGGRVVLSDIHPLANMTGAIAAFPGKDLRKGLPYVRSEQHQISDYFTAFRAAGLTVLDCREPVIDEKVVTGTPSYALYPDAARQAFLGLPYLLVWQLER
ncbi:MAG TPA: methyltransferase domain-containing protein [Actinophytocola sp.]|uniref:class I SAM-dependent methyltransferase n=1 Tax=Actinophytocola sp. TaxID=1872138 RepID=UPI002DDD6477|nr:methyltransferase domain-containing protein [Actinophytocola sp.]HEV2781003.1 methyltransferase domain-containing protein [Actinophytocola sp.]